MNKKSEDNDGFRFRLNLDESEANTLRKYLLKRKYFAINYILNRGSTSSNIHLYQLYLQYLSNKINEVEKSVLLESHLYILVDRYGKDCTESKRTSI